MRPIHASKRPPACHSSKSDATTCNPRLAVPAILGICSGPMAWMAVTSTAKTERVVLKLAPMGLRPALSILSVRGTSGRATQPTGGRRSKASAVGRHVLRRALDKSIRIGVVLPCTIPCRCDPATDPVTILRVMRGRRRPTRKRLVSDQDF